MSESGVRKRLPTQAQLFFLALLGLVLFLTWIVFKPFIIFMVTGIFVAVLALPLDKLWERLLPNRIAAFGTMLSIFLLITVPIVGLGFALFEDAETVVQDIQQGEAEKSLEAVLDIVLPDQTPDERNETLAQIWDDFLLPKVQSGLQSFLAAAPGFLGKLAIAVTIILFVTYYVLTDGSRLVEYVRRVAPLPDTQVDRLLAEAHGGLRAVFFGQILTSVIQGILGGIGFLIAGVPGAIIWAAVMAILSLLPVVGAFIVWIPAAIFLLVQGHIWQGIFLVAWGAIVVSQIDNFVRPKLIGDRADIHPLFVLVGVLGGVAAWGFIGLFLGPLLVGVALSILKVWESDYLDPLLAPPPPPSPPKKDRARDDGA